MCIRDRLRTGRGRKSIVQSKAALRRGSLQAAREPAIFPQASAALPVSDSGRAAPYPACGMPLPAGCAAAIPQYAAAAGYAALFLPEGLLRSAIRTAEAALLPSNETVGS